MRHHPARRISLSICLIVSLILLLSTGVGLAKKKDKPKKPPKVEKPVKLEIDSAQPKKADVNLLQASGWSLRISATVEDPGILSSFSVLDGYPDLNNQVYLIFEEPDACFSPRATQEQVCCGLPEAYPYDCQSGTNCSSTRWVAPHNETGEMAYFYDCPDNEQYMMFKTDLADTPKLEDSHVDPDMADALLVPFEMYSSSGTGGNELQEQSPYLGNPVGFRCVDPTGKVGAECIPGTIGLVDACENCELVSLYDGYGIGAPDDDWMGLVVLSNQGVGRVLDYYYNAINDQGYIPSDPIQARNLAPLVNNVTYDLSVFEKGPKDKDPKAKGPKKKDPKSKGPKDDYTYVTKVNATLVATEAMFTPTVLFDDCIGGSSCVCSTLDPLYISGSKPICSTEPVYSVDGGPWESMFFDESYNHNFFLQQTYPFLWDLLSQEGEITVMVVKGTAPGIITDSNGDLKIDEEDVEAMGYTVVSNVETYRYSVLTRTPMPGIRFDTDGNGTFFDVAPGVPGRVIRPPR